MLLNVSESPIPAYLDREEARVFADMAPLLHAGIRLQAKLGSVQAAAYVTEQGKGRLLRHYRRVSADQYRAVSVAAPAVANEEPRGKSTKAVQAILARHAMMTAGELLTKATRPGGEGLSDFLEAQLAELERRAGAMISTIARTLVETVNEHILKLIRDGKSNQEVTRQILSLAPDLSRRQAAVIARTEAHASAVSAIGATIEHKRIPLRWKIWHAYLDRRVRASHRDAHGQRRRMAEFFEVGEAYLMHPGDPGDGGSARGRRLQVLGPVRDGGLRLRGRSAGRWSRGQP